MDSGWVRELGQKLLAVLLGSLIVVGVLLVVTSGRQRDERDLQIQVARLQELTLNAALASACELALPVDADGRPPAAVRECFTQYGLEPPSIIGR
jgi:hypothetical protein